MSAVKLILMIIIKSNNDYLTISKHLKTKSSF